MPKKHLKDPYGREYFWVMHHGKAVKAPEKEIGQKDIDQDESCGVPVTQDRG